MCFFSRLFCCNNRNRNCRSSLCQNVRMRCVDARGDDDCAERNDRSGDGCGYGCSTCSNCNNNSNSCN